MSDIRIGNVTTQVSVAAGNGANGWDTAMQRLMGGLNSEAARLGGDVIWDTVDVSSDRRVIETQKLTDAHPKIDVHNVLKATATILVDSGVSQSETDTASD